MVDRSRRRPAEDDEDDVEVMSPLKRVKLERRREAEAEQDGDDADGHEDGSSSSGDSASDVDMDWDSDGDEADRLNLEAYNAVRQRARNLESRVAEAGILRAITLQNFMCHSHLSVDFKPRLNFIVGHNGSGKSAILTAVAVALGGSVNMTGRGGGLKDLIRHDCDKAAVILTLANSGVEAFRPDVYDEGVILIERHMDKNGTSGYKFRARRDGKVISTKRDELNAILARFSINADSPLTILTQDVAKSFLTSNDEHDFYKFFLRGTTLADLTTQYEHVRGNLEIVKNGLLSAKDSKPDVQNRLRRLQRDMEQARAAGDLQAKKGRLEAEQAWSYVVQKEEVVRDAMKRIADTEQRVGEIQVQLAKVQDEREAVERTHKGLADSLAEREKQKQPLAARKLEIERQIIAEKRSCTTAESALGEITGDIAAKREELATLERKIQDKAGANDRQRAYEEKRAQLEKIRHLRDSLQRADAKNRQQLEEAQDKMREMDRERENFEYSKNEATGKLNEAQRRLNMFEQQQTDNMSKFGQKIDIVLRAIDRERWHHSKPLGPLGQYVKLKDMQYANVMSVAIGSTMCAFAVRDSRDARKLVEILRNAARQGYKPGSGQPGIPAIIQHSGEIFDYSAGDLSSIGITLLSQLAVSNDEVLRILINSNSIESVLLAPNKMHAERDITRILGSRPATNSVRVLSAELWQQTGTRDGRQSGPLPAWRGSTLFVRDASEHIVKLKGEIAEAERRKNEVVQAAQAFAMQRQEALAALDKLKGDMTRTKTGIHDSTKRAQALENEVEAIQPETDDLLDNMREELQRELRDLEGERENLQDSLQNSQAKLDTLKDEGAKAERDLAEYAPETSRMRQALAASATQLRELASQQTQWEQRKAKYHGSLDEARESADDAAGSVKQLIRKATELCGERVETTRDPITVRKERVAVERAIADSQSRDKVDINVVTLYFNQARDQLKELETSISDLTQLVGLMESSLERRQKGWDSLRRAIAIRTRTAFISNLLKRNFDGRLRFDHDKSTLTIDVTTAANRAIADAGAGDGKKGGRKTPANLSGGERSFSTVSFLLALWDATPSAVRCLDEWDVFLDMANRQLAAKMLMEGARDCDGKQFLLITPQDMGSINVGGADNGVIRLQDPSRNQTTLNFAPA